MLHNIRKTADSWVMRVLLGFIAFAFVWWGIKDVLQTTNDSDLVTFSSSANNISESEFLQAKTVEINTIQKQMATTLSEEEIAELNIDNLVMRRLIVDRIMNYLVSYYDLDLSEDMVIELVKKSPVFQNDKKIFDINIFKTYFKNSYANEEEYLLNFKEKNLKHVLMDTFFKGFLPSKIMVKNIVDYMAESRSVELIEIDLKYVPKDFKLPIATSEQLEDFYQKNQKLFEIPEKRKFSYVKISGHSLKEKIDITAEELLDFYNENKDEFEDKDFDQVKSQLRDLLESQKIDELNMELAKNLEDDVAAGSSLIEIAEKYELPIQNIDYISYEDLLDNKIIAENAAGIFELVEGELSYPIEVSDKNLILVELTSIQPAKIPEFNEIKPSVNVLWQKQYISTHNLQELKSMAKEYRFDKKDYKYINNLGLKIEDFNFTRTKIDEFNTKISPDLLLSIFQTKVGSNSQVFQIMDKAYFAHVKSISHDNSKAYDIEQNSGEDILNSLKNAVIDELISYSIKKNNIKINNKARGN